MPTIPAPHPGSADDRASAEDAREDGAGELEAAPETVRGRGGRILRIPLLYKILGANGLLVAVTAILAVLFGRAHADPVEAAALAALVGLIVGVPLNWLLIHWALTPLWGLEATAERVQEGDLEARAPDSPLADADMSRLVDVFNHMLGQLVRGQRRLRRLSVGALEAAERERRSLAAELQDDAAQRLAALLLQVELARKAAGDSSPDPETSRRLETLRGQVAECLEVVRRLARRLHPPELGELGLELALRAHARAISEQAGIPVKMASDGSFADLPPEVALTLYRIAEEALVNAVRHAGAGSIDVRLEANHGVSLIIEDDGRGLPDGVRLGESGGLGLLGMRERARTVGGDLAIDSAAGHGTRVSVQVPGGPERS